MKMKMEMEMKTKNNNNNSGDILSYFKRDFTFEIHSMPLAFWQIKDIYEDYYAWGLLDFDVYLPTKKMNLQRPLVWNLEQKQKRIELIIKSRVNKFSPKPQPIFIIKYTDRRLWYKKIEIIDWKQRLSTIIEFIENKFPLNINWREYFYKDLEKINVSLRWHQLKFTDMYFNRETIEAHTIMVSDIDKITDEDKIKLFELINWTWTPQDLEHIKKLKNS